MREKEESHKQEMKEKDRQYQEMKEMRKKEKGHEREMREKKAKIARLELQYRHKGKISMCCIKKFHTPVTQN